MNDLEESVHHDTAQENLRHVKKVLESSDVPALERRLGSLHSADVARVLESLPRDQRAVVWDLVKADRDGEILLEVSDAVRESLIAGMDSEELLAAAETLDTDEIADLAPDLPRDVVQDLLDSLDVQNRARLQSVLSYPEDNVGSLMDFDMVTVREDMSLEVVLRYLRSRGELPDQTDKLFVVDRDNVLKGVLPLKRLLLHDPLASVAAVSADEVVCFHPEDAARDAALAFERYNLVTAPVVDGNDVLVGRITVDAMVDFIREESDSQLLSRGGLRDEEDLFAPVRDSTRNRAMWLGINLITAFLASAVIGLFERSIEQIVALAVLMPIVASMGGNAGTQTMTLVNRGLALDQIKRGNIRKLFSKELAVAYYNGLIWAAVVGVVAVLWYGDWKLSVVFGAAMLINLIAAALSGVAVPLVLRHLGYDPAIGTSVILTTVTDVVGFFTFLGLATLVLL
ncbi:MAG: magnesium transporter [Burkholderiales bacterium]